MEIKEHLTTKVAQYALIIRDKKMLILWPSEATPLWVLPGGRINNNDSNAIESLKREVREEISAEIVVKKPFYAEIYSVPQKGKRYAVFFICELTGEVSGIKLSEEHKGYEWLNYNSLMKNLLSDSERGKPGMNLINKLKDEGLL